MFCKDHSSSCVVERPGGGWRGAAVGQGRGLQCRSACPTPSLPPFFLWHWSHGSVFWTKILYIFRHRPNEGLPLYSGDNRFPKLRVCVPWPCKGASPALYSPPPHTFSRVGPTRPGDSPGAWHGLGQWLQRHLTDRTDRKAEVKGSSASSAGFQDVSVSALRRYYWKVPLYQDNDCVLLNIGLLSRIKGSYF